MNKAYAIINPTATKAKDTAIYFIVVFAVSTLGSRRIGIALLTASIPVYVPAPMLYALNKRTIVPHQPNCDVAEPN